MPRTKLNRPELQQILRTEAYIIARASCSQADTKPKRRRQDVAKPEVRLRCGGRYGVELTTTGVHQ